MIWSWLEIFFDERIGKASYLRFMEFFYIFSELTYFSFGAFHSNIYNELLQIAGGAMYGD